MALNSLKWRQYDVLLCIKKNKTFEKKLYKKNLKKKREQLRKRHMTSHDASYGVIASTWGFPL